MNILVIGDVIFDRYTHGSKRGLSAETPTIVANYEKTEFFTGGAGLVVRNLLALGNTVTLLSAGEGLVNSAFVNCSDPLPAEASARLKIVALEADDWQVSSKHRYYVDGYKLLQFDKINQGKWTRKLEKRFLTALENLSLPLYDAVIISDNRHGLLSKRIADRVMNFIVGYSLPSYVDSQVSQSESNHEWYKYADYFLLNEKECESVLKKVGKSTRTSDLDAIKKYLGAGHIVKKLGKNGALVYSGGRDIKSTGGIAMDSVDTCGAGDAFLAAFVSSKNDIEFANKWAALSTTYKGTIVPKQEDYWKVGIK